MSEFDMTLTAVEADFFAAGDELSEPETLTDAADDDVPALSVWQRMRRTFD